MEVTAGLAESNGSLLPGLWRDSLHVTCGLTACTLGLAPGPTLGNEYGKTLPLPLQNTRSVNVREHQRTQRSYSNVVTSCRTLKPISPTTHLIIIKSKIHMYFLNAVLVINPEQDIE